MEGCERSGEDVVRKEGNGTTRVVEVVEDCGGVVDSHMRWSCIITLKRGWWVN